MTTAETTPAEEAAASAAAPAQETQNDGAETGGSDEVVLSVEDLRVYYDTPRGPLKAVDGVSFKLTRGERLAIVGESGSGKSTLATALMRLTREPGRVAGGKVLLEGRDLLSLSADEIRKVRLSEIALVPQGAMNSLNPVMRVEDQIIDGIIDHSENGSPTVLVGHDMGLVAQFADTIGVMYAGRLVELAPVRQIFQDPLHPYTRLLINSLPSLTTKGSFVAIPGLPPTLLNLPAGCSFNPRCPDVFEICRSVTPGMLPHGKERSAACHLYDKEADG